jgi:uncharacterized protein YejL (UPF0352 family)
VDLRWGIGNEAAFEQKTLQICLREVDRCQNTFTIPHFLILLGSRYGWQPIPAKIARSEFSLIKKALASQEEDLRLLKDWYFLEKNDFPPSFRLKPRVGVFQSYEAWVRIEASLRKILRRTVRSLNIPSEEKTKYYLSATAHEIFKGILEPPYEQSSTSTRSFARLFYSLNPPSDEQEIVFLYPPVSEHIFCFYRYNYRVGPTNNDPMLESSYGQDLDENNQPDIEAQELLDKLKDKVKNKLGNNMIIFPQILDKGPQFERGDDLETFAENAYQFLSEVVNSQIEGLKKISSLDYEKSLHQTFCWEKHVFFKGRSRTLQEMQRRIKEEPSGITVIYGPGGIGKSALMAQIVEWLTQQKIPTLYRFVGLSASSSNILTLFESITQELSSFLGEPQAFRNLSLHALSNILSRLLEKAIQKMKDRGSLVIVLDALDQLSEKDQSFFLDWIVQVRIPNLHLCLSCLEGEPLQRLRNIVVPQSFISMPPLEMTTGRSILKNWLHDIGRTLQKKQIDLILEIFEKDGNPLYLKLAFEQAKNWSADNRNLILPRSVHEVLTFLFRKLSREHGDILVARVLSYLVISRYGLTEDELIDLLSQDTDVMEEFWQRSPQGKDLKTLPFMIWARLQDDLSSYLTERGADNVSVIDFFHRIFRTSIRDLYLSSKRTRMNLHINLTKFYSSQPDFLDGNLEKKPNLRRLSELPFHLKNSGHYVEFYTLLSHQSYCEAKIMAGRVVELLNEFYDCYDSLRGKSFRSQQINLPKILSNLIFASASPSQIDLEEIHAVLVYKENTRFYEKFLTEALLTHKKRQQGARTSSITKTIIEILTRKANLIRRKGNLSGAYSLLKKAGSLSEMCSDCHTQSSRILYELGYIAFLMGDFVSSIPYMDKSAEESLKAGNMTGYWISRCVAYHQRWLNSLLKGESLEISSKEFESILQEALPVFEMEKDSNYTAKRWVMNIYAHRFKLAFRLHDQEMAENSLTMLLDDLWIKEYEKSSETLEKIRGRFEILKGNIQNGTQILEKALQPIFKYGKKELLQREAIAEDFFDLGNAFINSGNKRKAEYWWNWAKDHLKHNPGSQVWIRLIEQQSR